jgi:hypothetical protein
MLRQRIITEPGRERLVLIVPVAGLTAALNGFAGDRMTLGSAARDEMPTDSDVDLLIEFEAGHSPSLAGFARYDCAVARRMGSSITWPW